MEAPAVHRQVLSKLTIHDRAHGRVRCVHDKPASAHSHGLVHGAKLQFEIDGSYVLHVQFDAAFHNAFETVFKESDPINSWLKSGNSVDSLIVCRCCRFNVCAQIRDSDLYARHTSPIRVRDQPRDRGQFIGSTARQARQAGKHQYKHSHRKSSHGRFSFEELRILISYSRFDPICVRPEV